MLSKVVRSSIVNSIWGARRDIIEHYKSMAVISPQSVDKYAGSLWGHAMQWSDQLHVDAARVKARGERQL